MGSFFQKSQPVTQETKTTLPPWLTAAAQNNINYASSLPDMTPYTGPGTAGLTPEQLQAIALAAGQPGMYGSQFNNAFGGATNAMNFAAPMVSAGSVANDASGLMNPYIQNVINASNTDIDRQKAIALQQAGSQAARAGATAAGVFDDRAGLLGTETERNFEDIRARTNSGLLSGGYSDALAKALGIAQGNQGAGLSGANINLQGANALGGLANTARTGDWGDITGLLNAGGVAQATDQAGKTFNYNEFIRQMQQPYQKLAAMQGVTAGAPHDSTTTGTQTQQQYSSPFMQMAGLGLAGASLLNPATAAAAGGKAAFGLLSNNWSPTAFLNR